MIPNFFRIQERVIPALREKHGYKNIHQIPKVEKVVVNSSVGAGADSKEALEIAKSEIALITGQRPIATLLQEKHRELQAPPRSGHRRQGDPARDGSCTNSSSV